MTPPRFPPELVGEITAALQAYVATRGGSVEKQQVQALTDRVCTYAHTAGMTPEGMLLALRNAYDTVVASRVKDEDQLRGVYDRLLDSCLTAYFDEQARRKS
jgi:hypothetical protein